MSSSLCSIVIAEVGGWHYYTFLVTAASQQFVWIRLYIASTVLWMLPVPELIKALYAAGLAWLGLAWLGYLFTQLQRCEPAVQLLLPLPLLSNPDSSLESEDNNT